MRSADRLSRRLPSLTGLRALLAFLVILTHATLVLGPYRDFGPYSILGITAPFATFAVSTFFVLSGFVLTWSARPDDTNRAFWRRRFFKIFPNHVTMLALVLLFILLFGAAPYLSISRVPGPVRPDMVVANLFLVQNWVPGRDWLQSGNSVAWSVCCEAFFYLLFPWLYRLVKRIPAHLLWRWCAAVAAVGTAVPFAAALIPGEPLVADAPFSVMAAWVAYVFPPSRLPEFILGILLARVVQERGATLRISHAMLALVTFIGISVFSPLFFFSGFYAIPAGILVVSVARLDVNALPSRFRSSAMVYLGDRSYALYMSHWLIIMATVELLFGHTRKFDFGTATAMAFLLFLPLSVAASWLLYRFVEHPLT